MIAATGPKNLVLVLDLSGSMTTLDRMGGMKRAAKKVIDSATHVDYIGIITFNDKASTYQDLTTLARASPQFRTRLKAFIDSLVPSGASNFIAGYDAAFSLVDSSRAKNYTTGCHTTYVLVTDGIAADPKGTVMLRQANTRYIGGGQEQHFVISLGSGTAPTDLRSMACAIGAVFTMVPDNDDVALQGAMIGYYKYYALRRSLSKVEGYSWTAPYASMPDIWGPMVSVTAPVYDKSREPWHMMGVASADATACALLETTPGTLNPKP